MNFRRHAALLAASVLAAAACTDSPAPSEPESVSPSYERSATAQDRLAALFPETSAEILALPGTVFADHDEARGKLVFGVENANAAQGVQRSLAARGLRTDEYLVRVVPPIVQVATLRDVFRPTIGGIQIHFGNYLCTLGFNVTHVSTGDRSFITNSHCTNSQGGVEGTTYRQPLSTVDGTIIATEVADPEYVSGISGCSRGKVCRRSDASRAKYGSTSSTQGAIAKTVSMNSGSLTTASTNFTITGQNNTTSNYSNGTVVHKVGRTTGWGSGTVTGSCVTVNVSGSNIQQICQTIVENPTAAIVGSGDSGSPTFTLDGSNATLVGILWGGGGSNLFVFSPLKNIQDELGAVDAVSGGGGSGGSEPPPEEPPCIPRGKGNNCK